MSLNLYTYQETVNKTINRFCIVFGFVPDCGSKSLVEIIPLNLNSNQSVNSEMTRHWLASEQKLAMRFGGLVPKFRCANVARNCCRN